MQGASRGIKRRGIWVFLIKVSVYAVRHTFLCPFYSIARRCFFSVKSPLFSVNNKLMPAARISNSRLPNTKLIIVRPLPIAEPITEIHGGPDLFINKGSTINLTCIVKFAPEPPPQMVWSHNSEVSKGYSVCPATGSVVLWCVLHIECVKDVLALAKRLFNV